MSLKVYSGIKFKSDDIQEVVSQLHERKNKAWKNSIDYAKANPDLFVWCAVKEFEDAFGVDIDDRKFQWDAADKIKASLKKQFREYDDPNFTCRVVVIPWNGHLYGCAYPENIKANEELIAEIADEYHYQDQTDKPDEISDEEWDERSEVWNAIFDKYWTPAEAGLTYELVAPENFKPNYIKEIFENFRKEFVLGWEGYFNLKEDVKKEFIKTGILYELPKLSPGNVGVVNFAYYSSHTGFNVVMRTEAEVDLVKKALEPYAEFFESAEYKNEMIRLDNLCKEAYRPSTSSNEEPF